MLNFYRIAKKDVDTLLGNFSVYASKDVGRYKRIGYEKWKRLKDVDSWEIRFSDDGVHEDGFYSLLYDGITIRAIKGDPADNNSESELFEFQPEDGSFGSFLQYERMEGVLILMSSMFDNNMFADVSAAATTVANYDDTIATLTPKDYWCDTATNKITSGPTTITIDGDVILNGSLKINEDKGDKKTMNMNLNLDFGNCKNDNIRLSPYGIAVRNAKLGTWVSYDPKGNKTIDVNDFVMDGTYLYKLPVAVKDVKAGDVVLHNKVPMYVEKVENDRLLVIDPVESEEKIVLPITNMFGFNFVTKVVSIMDMSGVAPTADSPFGNMLPFMMASNGNIDPVMLMLMSGKTADFTSNPMMLYFLLDNKGNKNDNLLPLMMMMNGLELTSTDKK